MIDEGDPQRHERRGRLSRLAIQGQATRDELLEYARLELEECIDCLQPTAPKNGRSVDGHHASACAMRTIATLIQLRKLLDGSAAPVAMPVPGDGTPRHPG